MLTRRSLSASLLATLLPKDAIALAEGSDFTFKDVSQVFQRAEGTTRGRPYLTGTYIGSPPSLEAQVRLVSDNSVVAAWQPVVSFRASGGIWRAQGPSVAQSPDLIYKIEVRRTDNGLTVSGTQPWGIGIIFLMHGQSNENSFAITGDGTVDPPRSGIFTWNKTTKTMSPGGGGNAYTKLLNAINQTIGVCVMGFTEAIPATNIPFLVGDAWDQFVDPDIRLIGGDIEFIHWHQGENNFQYSFALTQTEYRDQFFIMRSKIRSLTGRTSVPIYVSSLASVRDPTPWNSPVGTNWAGTQKDLIDLGNEADIHYVNTNMDFTCTDGVHYDPASCTRWGQRVAQSILFYMGAAAAPAKWFITGASIVNATTTRVTVAHSMGTDFTPTSEIKGFEVSGNTGATWLDSTGARVDTTHIDLTHPSLSTVARQVRYLHGIHPDISAPVRDNSSIAVALNHTTDIIHCPETTPVPQVQVFEHVPPFNHAAKTISCPGQKVVALSGDLLVICMGQNGDDPPATVTITPEGHSAISFTKIVGTNGPSIWQAIAPYDIPNLTCPLLCVYKHDESNGNVPGVFVIAGANLNSTTPTSSAAASATFPSIPSISLKTSANGCIIAVTRGGGALVFSGAETYCDDSPIAGGCSKNIVFAHAAPVSANASSNLTIKGADQGLQQLAAATWR